jgi:protein-lysine N-methyltransferase EEF2KMT
MNPIFNLFGCVLLVVAEWKPVGTQATYNNEAGIKLVTAYNRRNTSSCLDSKIHHCNLINNSTSSLPTPPYPSLPLRLTPMAVLPKIQANQSGAADALMLDTEGFVSETNATNIFLIKRGVVVTPSPDSCLPGLFSRSFNDS